MIGNVHFIVAVLSWQFSKAEELCQPETITTYTIGQGRTLIDIDSEAISSLKETCYKQLHIPGAVNSSLLIGKASFGGNKYFKYANGMIRYDISWDKVFFSQSKCPNSLHNNNIKWTELTGKTRFFSLQSCELCFKFQPARKGFNLGSHIRGKGFRVELTIDVGPCNRTTDYKSFILETAEDQGGEKCQELCSATEILTKCPEAGSTIMSPPLIIRESSTTMYSPTTASLSTLDRSTKDVNSNPKDITAASILRHPQHMNKEHIHKTQATTMQSVSNSVLDIVTSSEIDFLTTNTMGQNKSLLSLKPSTTMEASTKRTNNSMVYSGSTSYGHLTTHPQIGFYLTVRHQTKESTVSVNFVTKYPASEVVPYKLRPNAATTATSSVSTFESALPGSNEALKDNKLFGLVDGLYILVGCVLLVLIIVIVTCCIFRFRKYRLQDHTEPDCFTISSHNETPSESYKMPWQNNWLVRYHTSPKPDSIGDEETISQSEKENPLIHGSFVHQSNPELHLIHTGRVSSDEHHESIYDNAHYVLKLQKADLDAKVKDVLKKQRPLSITSYDSNYRPIERRRAYTLSESSINSTPDSDKVFEWNYTTCHGDKEHGYRSKCKRSSSAVSGESARCGRIGSAGGRHRTISQTSKIDDSFESKCAKSNLPPNDLNYTSTENQKKDHSHRFARGNQNELEKQSATNTNSNLAPQKVFKEEYNREHITPGNLPRKDEAEWTVNAVYALVSQQHGASGTMQFKK